LFIGTCQSFLSCLSALVYILIRGKKGASFSSLLGLELPQPAKQPNDSATNGTAKPNGTSNGHTNGHGTPAQLAAPLSRNALLLSYLQCSTFITLAAPFGFAALSYITYPTMVLGKSCKLVPVMLMNVLMYRRRFAPHKYLVVAMVTAGITVFMAFGSESPSKSSKHGVSSTGDAPPASAQLVGAAYLLVNLLLDGAVNSTQDEIFAR